MSATGITTAATIASSTALRLRSLAQRVHSAGPNMVLRLMAATLTTSDVMAAIEYVGAATLPLPVRVTCIPERKPRAPHLRLVK